MADAGLNAIEKAIFAQLNHASVTALVPAARHMNGVVRPSTTYPVILVAFMGSDPNGIDSFSGEAETLDYAIRGYVEDQYSLEEATDIAEAIDARLNQITLTATGYSGGVFGIRRQRWLRGIEVHYREPFRPESETARPYPYAGAVYRFWTQRS